jgi:hypothetical protein
VMVFCGCCANEGAESASVDRTAQAAAKAAGRWIG